jgi:signal transduction histidine kinase
VYSSIVYPLVAGGRTLGVLNLNRVASRRPFRDSDLVPAGVLAAHCVLALENARLTREFITTERLAGVGELAAGIAHEINNPMVALLANLTDVRETLVRLQSFGDMVESGATSATLREVWAELGGCATVADMQLALVEAEAGASRIRAVTAEVRALAGYDEGFQSAFKAPDTIRAALRVAGVHLRHRVAIEDGLSEDTWMWGSAGAMSQAICSLLVAGAEAIDESSSTASISVGARREGDRVLIEINHPWLLAGLRVPGAWRSEETTGRQAARARGLWVAREISRRHGGELQVSQVGGGTRFTLVLPHLTVGAATMEEERLMAATQ